MVEIEIQITSVCLGADCFAFGELLGNSRKSHHPQVTKGACSWLGPSFVGVPSLRSCSVGPPPSAIHGGGRLSRHPCSSAHSTRPAFSLHPSRDWRCLGFLRMKIEDQELKQIKGFPAEAGPTVEVSLTFDGGSRSPLIVPTLCVGMHLWTLCVPWRQASGLLDARGVCGTGFSREGGARSAVHLTDQSSSSSRSRKRSSAGSMSSRSMAPKPSIRPSRAAASL